MLHPVKAPTTWSILRVTLFTSFVWTVGIGIGILTTVCFIGIVFVATSSVSMLRTQLSEATVITRRYWLADLGMMAVYLVVLITGLIGGGLGELLFTHVGPDAGPLLGAAGLVALLFAALSPVSFLLPALLDTEVPRTLGAALDVAVRTGGRQSARQRLIWVLLATAQLVLPALALYAAGQGSALGWLALVGWLVSAPTLTASMAKDYVRLRRLTPDVGAPTRLPSELRLLIASAGLVSAVGTAVVVGALLLPSPARRQTVDPVDEGPLPTRVGPLGPHGLQVSALGERGLLIETADGGGAGRVAVPFDVANVIVEPWPEDERRLGDDTRYRIVASVDPTLGTGQAVVLVDASGTRLDDGFAARLERVGGARGLLVWCLVAIAWLGFFVFSLRRLATARRLVAITSADDLGEAAGDLRALDGHLRVNDGTLVVDGDRLRVEGSGYVEGTSLRVRIPSEGVRVLGAEKAYDGAAVALVGEFSTLTSEGLRTSVAPWPQAAMLVVGGRNVAAHELTRAASKHAARWLVAVVVAALAQIIVAGYSFL